MMGFTPTGTTDTNANNISSCTIVAAAASRKRRSESAQMFQSPSQENENMTNHSTIVESPMSSSSLLSSPDVTSSTTTGVIANTTTTDSSTMTTTKVQMKVRIRGYHSVAHWTWGSNTKDDVCSICQNAFEGVCPGVKYPGEDCPVVWGKCLHAFHLQCINTWLTSSVLSTANNAANTKSSCPICRQEWEFSSSNPAPPTRSVATTTLAVAMP